MRYLLTLLFAMTTYGQGLLIDSYRFGIPCGSFTAQTAVFDGSADWLSISEANITGLASSKVFTLAFWLQSGADGGTRQIIQEFVVTAANLRFQVLKTTANKLQVQARNAANANILDATSNQTILVAGGWTHVYLCIDLANSANRHWYFNGVEDASVTWTTYTDDTIAFFKAAATFPTTFIGDNASNAQKLNGALAEFWLDDTYLNDPTKFICTTAGTHPISLGATGNLPTGSAPAIYLSLNGSGDSWRVDSSGNGNTFTVNGALGSTTSP